MSSDRGPAGLTTRAAVLGLVICGLVVSTGLPLREFLSQRAQISQLQQSQAQTRARVKALQEEKARLADPAYVAALARDRLHFVRPGEVAYVVLTTGAAGPSPSDARLAASAPAGPQAPWYSRLWGTVRSADRPTAVRPTAVRPAP